MTKNNNNSELLILQLKNFKNFSDNISFKFSKGLNIIEAPNASGKSSIFSALKVLFSDSLEEEKLINNRSHPSEINLLFGDLKQTIVLENNSNNNQKIILKEQTIFKKNDFVDDVCIISENHPVMKAAQLKDFGIISTWLNSLTDYSVFKKMKDVAENVIIEYKTEKNKAESNLYARKKQLLSLQNTLLSRKNMYETLYQSEINSEFENKEYEELILKERNLKNRLNNLENEIRRNKAEKEILEKEKEKAEQLLISRKKELKRILDVEDSIPTKVEEIEEEIKQCKLKNKELTEDINRINIKYTEKKKKTEDLEILLTKNELFCPTCYQEINVNTINEKLQELKKEKEELSIRLRKVIKEQEINLKTQKEWERKRNQLILDTPEQRSTIEKQINQCEIKIRQANLKIPKVKKEVEVLEEEYNNLNNKYNEIVRKVSKFQTDFEEKNKKIAELRSKLEEINEQLNQISEEIARIEVQTNELSFYDIYIQRVEKLNKIIAKKIDFIQFDMIDQINDELELLSKELNFNEIKEIYIDDSFNLIIIKNNSEPISYSDLSMFERKTVGVIIILVLKKILADSFPILAIDEYLNALDEERDMGIIDYLKNKDLFVILTKSAINMDNNSSQTLSQENIKQWS